jgi:predicted secreted Zn-dependent protease
MLPSTYRRPGGAGPLAALCVLLLASALLLPLPTEAVWQRIFGPAPVVLTAEGAGPGGSATISASNDVQASVPPGTPDDAATAAPPDAVRLTSETEYYPVEGSSLRALLTSLRERGPSDGHGTWAANTAWVFRWSYKPVSGAECRVGSASVELALTYTYPQWTAPVDASPAVVAAWEGYLARVELHEHGHRDIAEAAAADLVKALEALPAQSSCDALAATARSTAGQILTRHADDQRAYDLETGHGATQGAVLTAQ